MANTHVLIEGPFGGFFGCFVGVVCVVFVFAVLLVLFYFVVLSVFLLFHCMFWLCFCCL